MSGGLNLNVRRSSLPDRGLRSPQHVGYVVAAQEQQLLPFMAAPVLPGESLVGMSLRGDSIMRALTMVAQSPLCYADLAYWYIPLSALDRFFVEMYAASGEDKVEAGATTLLNPTSSILNAPNPVSDQGHTTPGLQATVREWAGEIGGQDGSDNRVQGSEYLPLVSWATWKVASDWYDLGVLGSRWGDSDLFDSPPLVERYIRSATSSHFTLGAGALDDITTGGGDNIDNLSQIVEKMFLLAQPEMTYPEILAAAGVNVMRNGGIGGLALPIMHQQHVIRQQAAGNVMFGKTDTDLSRDSVLSGSSGAATQIAPVPNDPDGASFFYQRSAVGHLSCNWSENRRRNLFIEEPGIILGTICWYSLLNQDSEYAHMFDITRMTGPGHWGRPSPGGVDEEDFVKRDQLYDRLGTGLQAGADIGAIGNQTGDAVLNMLNLYLNGDVSSTGLAQAATPDQPDPGGQYRFFDPMGDIHDSRNSSINHRLSTQLHVLSPLVA